MSRPARVLVIAGSDSGGGAGIQADIKTVSLLGGHAMTAITAVTAQNSRGVAAVEAMPAAMVLAQMDAVLDDFGADAVKIGMIGSAGVAQAVAERLERHLEAAGPFPVVFDPVMVATSGAVLADAPTIAAFGRLMRLSTLVTPNLPELAALGGEGAVLAEAPALLVKGGHAPGAELVDRLLERGERKRAWRGYRIDSPHTHGTGCTLASAIACLLAEGHPLAAAIAGARVLVREAILAAPSLVATNGPLGHAMVDAGAMARVRAAIAAEPA